MIRSIPWNGQTIIAPSIISGMDIEQYHRGDICSGPSVSSSGARAITAKSPKHFYDTSPLNPNRAPPETKKHFDFGRAVHHLFFGEKYFSQKFAMRPEMVDGEAWQSNRKACKAWLADQRREGKAIVTDEDFENIKGMAQSLWQHDLVKQGLLNGGIEQSLFTRDAETGLWIKARPDATPNDSGDFVDLKTTASVLYRDLQKATTGFGYCQQAAMVIDVARALGIEAATFSLAFVEKDRPWPVRVVTLKDDDIARGSALNRIALRTIATCLASGKWPGPGDDRPDAEYLELPDWWRKSVDDRVKFQLREAA